MQQILQQDVKYVKGVGPVRADLLHKELGISTLGDLLFTFPYRYDDRSQVTRICDLMEGMPAVQIKGHVLEFFKEGSGHKQRLIATFTDGTGYCELVWFRGIKYVEKTVKANCEYLVFGKPTFFKNRFNIGHPEMENLTAAKERHSRRLDNKHSRSRSNPSPPRCRLEKKLLPSFKGGVRGRVFSPITTPPTG